MFLGKWQVGSDKLTCSAVARTDLDRQLLANEASTLEILDGTCAPRLLSFCETAIEARLEREFISGLSLANLCASKWPAALAELRAGLPSVHAKGIIHCDIKLANIVIGPTGVSLVDWEHAMTQGTPLATAQFRAVSIGTACPKLIWGKGCADIDIDHYALKRLEQMVHQ